MDSSSLDVSSTPTSVTSTNASIITPPTSAPTRDQHGRVLPRSSRVNGSARGLGGRFVSKKSAARTTTTTTTTTTPRTPAVDSDDAMNTTPTAATPATSAPAPSTRTPQDERQAVVNDFHPVTVQLPDDLQRSLALIRTIDDEVAIHRQKVHEGLQLHKELPKMPAAARPNAGELRAIISFHLDRMELLRRTSVEEARNMVALVRQNVEWLENARVLMVIRNLVDKIEGRTSTTEESFEGGPWAAEGEDSAAETTGATNRVDDAVEVTGATGDVVWASWISTGGYSTEEALETTEGEDSAWETPGTEGGDEGNTDSIRSSEIESIEDD